MTLRNAVNILTSRIRSRLQDLTHRGYLTDFRLDRDEVNYDRTSPWGNNAVVQYSYGVPGSPERRNLSVQIEVARLMGSWNTVVESATLYADEIADEISRDAQRVRDEVTRQWNQTGAQAATQRERQRRVALGDPRETAAQAAEQEAQVSLDWQRLREEVTPVRNQRLNVRAPNVTMATNTTPFYHYDALDTAGIQNSLTALMNQPFMINPAPPVQERVQFRPAPPLEQVRITPPRDTVDTWFTQDTIIPSMESRLDNEISRRDPLIGAFLHTKHTEKSLTVSSLKEFLKENLSVKISVDKSDSEMEVSVEVFMKDGDNTILIASDFDTVDLDD